MEDLTEKILSLDLEAALVLKDAKVASIDAKMSADKHADQKMEKVQQLFKEVKKSEAKVLESSHEEEKKRARISLDQKVKEFDERVNVDAGVEYLINVAKEQICP